MGALHEQDIFECLAENFRIAAEKCEKLAWHPKRGYEYLAFRSAIRLIEGACRQAAAHREDWRWLPIGMAMGEIHKRCGGWMRSSATKDARKAVEPHFKKTAEILRALAVEAERVRTAATGRLGMILPEPLPGPHRDTRPVQVKRPSGLILPASYVEH